MENRESGGRPSGGSWILVILFWAYVMIPLAWGVYQTFDGVMALFAG
ncbi:oxalate:formate antiporter [Rubrobacter taiwanensis]|jgi:hypothetical protein|uniref:Oxalate:formate antiporter n=1 Tax=Rubrobacter taiwanensis TaxID=185139 RepID=A0A4R1BRY1_9ACTN|nr:oxalate:formate antiporter [Rubrobacter taiwanensis]